MRHRLHALALSLALLAAGTAFAASRQLVLAPGNPNVTVNGQPAVFQNPPVARGSAVLVPLTETLNLLSLPAVDVHDAPIDETGATTVNGQLYVDLRWLASATGSTLDPSRDGRAFTLTAPLVNNADPTAPQARFAPEKGVYAPGEKVTLVDYSFDPEGQAVTKREWSGRQDAYYQPGEYVVSLKVTNAAGKVSPPYSRTIRVQGAPVATPLTYALRNTGLNEAFNDPLVLGYPALAPRVNTVEQNFPLLFSDSPEKPAAPGVLYRDTVSGRARLLAYHVNGLGAPARVYVVARNLEDRPVTVRSVRAGETAPSKTEGTLGQVALLDFLTSEATPQLTVESGRLVTLYSSPVLTPGAGANFMQDVETDGRVELSFVILPADTNMSVPLVAALPVLPLDGQHQRGTFPGAVRRLSVTLGQLPARLNIGDGQNDRALSGTDVITGTPMKLLGNYGVLYEVQVTNAAGAVVALAPRGGAYRGALRLTDGPDASTMRVPRSGVLTKPDVPQLLWRARSDVLNLSFVPANGSNLPVSLVFYRP
ncbi:hypothetical protein [Deinococcus pimensis]|uniref:hypothetical protein n=1 Tax=Deinococcus pimensis TaxID=309888 RepID=UPI00048740DF|nr:hypothetical protein [Deinococcus pimensis]